jgi:hypothetical protein
MQSDAHQELIVALAPHLGEEEWSNTQHGSFCLARVGTFSRCEHLASVNA